jgi:hypothetical protein
MSTNSVGSWIYLFSKFTPEALLFESFLILFLSACYLAFWVLRKRRMGSIESEVPASLVKVYLNQLIVEAEQLRAQLFGLLSGAGAAPGDVAAMRSITPEMIAQIASKLPAAAPQAAEGGKLQALEGRMADQARAMETLVLEKTRIEKELADARAAGAKAGAAPSGDDGTIAKLQEKIRILEAKLAEYSVIEDDLANLKRLQQENAQLRAALDGKGPVPAPVSVAANSVAVPVAATASAPAPEPAAAAAAEAAPEPAVELPADAAPAVDAAEPEAAAEVPEDAPAEPGFEALVDDVEKSLQDVPVAAAADAGSDPEEAAPAEETPNAQESTPLESLSPDPVGDLPEVPAAITQEKSDADLVAEFEKMLKG